MDDLTAKLAHPLERDVHVRNGEVRERHAIARARSPRMETESGISFVCLPALAFATGPALELDVQEPAPEPASPGGVVRRELHEAQREDHASTIVRR
jgi:hypothetical protein